MENKYEQQRNTHEEFWLLERWKIVFAFSHTLTVYLNESMSTILLIYYMTYIREETLNSSKFYRTTPTECLRRCSSGCDCKLACMSVRLGGRAGDSEGGVWRRERGVTLAAVDQVAQATQPEVSCPIALGSIWISEMTRRLQELSAERTESAESVSKIRDVGHERSVEGEELRSLVKHQMPENFVIVVKKGRQQPKAQHQGTSTDVSLKNLSRNLR